jgi:hypothetical protein
MMIGAANHIHYTAASVPMVGVPKLQRLLEATCLWFDALDQHFFVCTCCPSRTLRRSERALAILIWDSLVLSCELQGNT